MNDKVSQSQRFDDFLCVDDIVLCPIVLGGRPRSRPPLVSVPSQSGKQSGVPASAQSYIGRPMYGRPAGQGAAHRFNDIRCTDLIAQRRQPTRLESDLHRVSAGTEVEAPTSRKSSNLFELSRAPKGHAELEDVTPSIPINVHFPGKVAERFETVGEVG